MENTTQETVNNSYNFKEIIKTEYKNCIQNIPYFIKKYIQIEHPQRGRIPFHLYLFQEKVVNLFNRKDKYIIINKSRQLGVSTLVAAYALWLILFHENKNILVIATKQDTAKNMISKVRFMYDNLPRWLKLGEKPLENNKLSLKLNNGSQIKAVSAAADSGRSEAVSLLIIDEAAFIEDIDEIFPSAQQTLATGGQCIAISTPKGTGNWFYTTFSQAELNTNGFLPIKLPWNVHPERDQSWRDEQDKILGKKMAAQECDCNFNTSGDTVIDAEIIDFYDKNYAEDPIEKRGISGDFWIWEYPDYSKNYMLVADVARGDDRDYSVFHIIDITAFKQVAEFKSKIPTRDFAKIIISAGTEWNNALVVVENSGVGWDVVSSLVESNYINLYYSPKGQVDPNPESYIARYDSNQTTPGFTNSTRTRPLVVSKLKEAIHDKSLIIKSKRWINELRTFIWEGGKAQASKGNNDDLCLSGGIGCYIRDVSIRFDEYNRDLSKSCINNITRHQPFKTISNSNNSWRMQIGDKFEDISWLL